jgi:cytochrome P450
MRRVATDALVLPDGIRITKGETVMVSSRNMWDSSIYPEADKFDGYRFLKMRDVGDEQSSAQLVSTGPDHLGFGYGSHACPGRFLAANEVKVILCHMLLKYEWKFVENCRPDVRISGTVLQSDPHAKISIRRRQEEILL